MDDERVTHTKEGLPRLERDTLYKVADILQEGKCKLEAILDWSEIKIDQPELKLLLDGILERMPTKNHKSGAIFAFSVLYRALEEQEMQNQVGENGANYGSLNNKYQ